MSSVSSPCTRICLLDRRTGLCEGCGRTGDEIARWSAMPEEERRAIVAALDARVRTAFPDAPGRRSER